MRQVARDRYGIPLAPLARVLLLASLLAAAAGAGLADAADTAVNFDGTNDYIYLGSPAALQDVTDRSFSWCAWVKPQDTPPACDSYGTRCVYAVLARPGNHTYIGYTNAQQFSARIWNSSNASFTLASGVVGPGAWHHTCLAVDDAAKQMAFYVDGVQVAGSPKTYTGALKDYGGNPHYIGAANPNYWAEMWFFKGAIDEVRVYNRALSAANVSAQHNGGLGQYGVAEAGLVAGWHLNEGAGWVAGDYAGSGNTGILANDPGWTAGRVATPAGATPPPTPQGITLEAENMPTKTGGSSNGWAWTFYTNGSIEQPVSFSPATHYVFAVVAAGNWDGTYPKFELRLDQQVIGADVTSSSGTKTYGFLNSGISAGTHQVAVTYTTDYNNQNLTIDCIRLVPGGASAPTDTAAPTVSVTAPAAGATVSGSVTVTANASDDVGVVGVQFKLDGANLGAEDAASPYSVTWDTKTATNGSHALTAVARDASGKSTASSPVTVTVSNDATPPTISGISATSTSMTSAAVSCATDEPATCTVDYGSTTGYGQTATAPGPATSHTISLTGLSIGATYHYRIRCKDAAGNERITPDGTFITQADTIPPAITFTSPKNGDIIVAP